MELRSYLLVLRKNILVIILVTVIFGGAAAAYTFTITPQYRASSTVFVSIPSDGTVSDLQTGNTFSQQRVKSYSALVTKPVVLDAAIAELGLDVSAASLAERVTAAAVTDTALIDIEVTDSDAVRSADLASAIAASLSVAVDELEMPVGTTGASPVKVTEVEAATVPARPVSPNAPLNIALGILLGLAVGLGVSVLRDAFDVRIRSQRDVTAQLRRPIIGGIVYDASTPQHPLVVQEEPFGRRAEAFRALRTNLQFLDVDAQNKSFIVTSSIEGEGKSTTIANLALALADAGVRVLLVDADLRRPTVAKQFGVPDAVGLTDVLIGRAEAMDVIQPIGDKGLSVLTAGTIPPNPSELIGSRPMATLVADLGRDFDVVLYDVPPLLPVTDPAILSKLVGTTILVVAAGRTTKAQLRGAVSALENVGSSVSGVILTMLPSKGPDAEGYGRYSYGYGYTSAAPAADSEESNAPAR